MTDVIKKLWIWIPLPLKLLIKTKFPLGLDNFKNYKKFYQIVVHKFIIAKKINW